MALATVTPTLDPYRSALATAAIPYARRIARLTISPLATPAEREELIGDGMVGLVQAAAAYRRPRGRPPVDPASDGRFRAYAARRVRGAVLDALRTRDPLTRAERRTLRDRDPRADQRAPVHFSTVDGLANRVRTPEVLPVAHGLPPAVADAMRALSPTLRRVLIETSAHGRTLRDVAADLHMSESGVCRARQRALALVRRSLQAEVMPK